MYRSQLIRIVKYSLVGSAAVGTYLSLRNSQYQINSIGIVRLSRAACTVFDIAYNYKSKLYALTLDKESDEYQETKSTCHTYAAEKLLKLCCTNKGVFIKVGQHIAALDYLLPQEYVQTMKILHSKAPANTLDEVLNVIKEDLKRDVS